MIIIIILLLLELLYDSPISTQVEENWDFCLFCFKFGFPVFRTVLGTW